MGCEHLPNLSRPSQGVLTLGGEERYILIPLRAYAAIINAVYDVTGPAATGPLYYIGKMIGEGLVEELLSRTGSGGDWREAAKRFVELLMDLGFGEIDILELSDKHAAILLKNPPSLVGAKMLDAGAAKLAEKGKACHLEAGMAAGALEKLLGRRVVAREKPSSEGCLVEARVQG